MQIRGTTIVAVRRNGKIAIAGDGQVTMGEKYIAKSNAVKVRRIYDGKVVIGFAGATADAFNLSEKFEKMLKKYSGNLTRASVELAQLWRSDKALRNLEALMIVACGTDMYMISGVGDVIEPDGDILAIGSGGEFARSSAMALLENTTLEANEIARKAIEIAGRICVYTNDHITLEEV